MTEQTRQRIEARKAALRAKLSQAETDIRQDLQDLRAEADPLQAAGRFVRSLVSAAPTAAIASLTQKAPSEVFQWSLNTGASLLLRRFLPAPYARIIGTAAPFAAAALGPTAMRQVENALEWFIEKTETRPLDEAELAIAQRDPDPRLKTIWADARREAAHTVKSASDEAVVSVQVAASALARSFNGALDDAISLAQSAVRSAKTAAFGSVEAVLERAIEWTAPDSPEEALPPVKDILKSARQEAAQNAEKASETAKSAAQTLAKTAQTRTEDLIEAVRWTADQAVDRFRNATGTSIAPVKTVALSSVESALEWFIEKTNRPKRAHRKQKTAH